MQHLVMPRLSEYPPLADSDAQGGRAVVLAKIAAGTTRYVTCPATRIVLEICLNAGDAATLFDEYNVDRARYRVAVHPAATWIREELFRRALTAAPAMGKERIVFTAGGNAVGKTPRDRILPDTSSVPCSF